MDLFEYVDRAESASPTPSTPTAGPSSLPQFDDRPFSQLKAFGRSVYKDVWNEFYDWEPGYCEEILRTIAQLIPVPKPAVTRVAKAMVARLVEGTLDVRTPARVAEGSDTVVVSVAHFAPGGRQPQARDRGAHLPAHASVTDVSIPLITIDAYEPYPQYESCTPASRSVLMTPTLAWHLPFLPYADDDRFPAKEYQANFDVLEWEFLPDPDEEMIQIETVRRLNLMHGIDVLDIDRMGMFKQFHILNNAGLLYECSQRDVLHWPGAARFHETQERQLPVYTPNPENLRQRLMSNLKVFCPSINCLHAACETHDNLHVNTYIPSKKPQLTGQDMILSEGTPCGPDCFRHIQDFERFMETLPPSPSKSTQSSSMDTLETILGIAPDLFPCQLATICLKPCKQVFVQRLQLFPDHTILPADANGEEQNYTQQRRNRERFSFVDIASVYSCELLAACAHPGSCTSNQCQCYVQKQHCSLMCRCGVKCKRQWPTCNCPNGKCLPNTCACAKNSRECIPGICLCHTGKPCDNTKMQRMASKPIEIKTGKYGLGAFACQNMNKGAFLGSYVGHILNSQLADPISELAKHTGLNYLFEVTPDQPDVPLPIFDAAHLGNATRFLNHGEAGRANVEARTMLVIGEHQIGFFTKKKVKAGEELFLDYGDTYWKDTKR